MSEEKKTVELNEKDLKKVSGGKPGINGPTCKETQGNTPCENPDIGIYASCDTCMRNLKNWNYNPLTGAYEQPK